MNAIDQNTWILIFLSKQIEERIRIKKPYWLYYTCTPDKIFDFSMFMREVIALDYKNPLVIDLLQRIYHRASKLITMYEQSYFQLNMGKTDEEKDAERIEENILRFTLYSDGSISICYNIRKAIENFDNKPGNHDIIDDDDIFHHYSAIVDFLRPLMTEKKNDESEKKTRTTEKKNKRKSPKPIKPFPEYLHMPNWDEKDNVKAAEFLREKFKGKIGKTIAHMIIALKGINAISFENRNDLYRSMEEYFGESIGTISGINKYMVDKAEDDDCKLIMSEILKEYLFQK